MGLALAAYPLTVRTLGDQGWLVVALCLALPGYAAWFAVRGELAGQGHLQRYGLQLVVDGASRLVGAGVLVLADQATTAGFGLLFGLSPWLTLALTLPGWRLVPGDRRPVDPAPLTRPLALLVVSALAAQLLINAGPLVVNLLATAAERDLAGVYLAVLVVVRIPVFLFSAVQPGYLRALSEHAARPRTGRRSSGWSGGCWCPSSRSRPRSASRRPRRRRRWSAGSSTSTSSSAAPPVCC